MPQPFSRVFLPLALVAALLVCARLPAAAGEWTVDLSASNEKDTAVDVDGALTTESVEKAFEVSFDTELDTDLTFSTSFSHDISDSIEEDAPNTTDRSTSLEAELQSQWWTVSAGWDQDLGESDDPAEPGEVSTSWNSEVKIEPEYEDLPEASFKIEGDEDSISRGYEGAFEYSFLELLDISLDVSKDVTDARPRVDNDDDSRSFAADVSIDHEIWEKIALSAEWSGERAQDLQLTWDDRLVEKTDTLDNSVKGKIEYSPLEWVESSVERAVDWAKDLQAGGPAERSDTWSSEVSATPAVSENIELEFGYADEREKTSGTDSDSGSWSQDYNSAITISILERADFDASYDRSDSETNPKALGESRSESRDDDYSFELGLSFLDDQLEVSVTRELSKSWEDGSETNFERTWDFEGSLSWEALPTATVDPSYSVSTSHDVVEGTRDQDRTIGVELTYSIDLGGKTTVDFDHSYERVSNYPSGESTYLERSDDTSIEVGFSDFLEGMSSTLSWERSASDQSEDDLGPEVDYSHSFSFEWSILENYDLAFDYEHEISQESVDSESYSSSFGFSIYDDRIEVGLEHEFSVDIGGEKNETHRYLVEISGSF